MRVSLRPEVTLGLMARERPRSAVVAEAAAGEGGSDGDSSASLEEITADDFRKDSSSAAAAPQPARSRVWMGYPMSRSYAPALYSFAWAQAVQNKPLGLGPAKGGRDDDDEEVEHEVVVDSSDGEKEEGEIEEGEAGASPPPPPPPPETIDLDSDAPEKESEEKEAAEADAAEEEICDFDQRVGTILEELEMITIEEAEKDFEATCARLLTCFESLKPMFLETGSPMPVLDALVQQAFDGINTISTVALSHNFPRREQRKDLALKLFFRLKNQFSDMLTPDRRNELDNRVRQLVFEDGDNNATSQNSGSAGNANNIAMVPEKPSVPLPGQVSSEKLPWESRMVNPFGSSASLPSSELPAALRNRVVSPLLDLHADYDESSLPSPTRDNAPPLPIPKPIGYGGSPVAPAQPAFPERVEPGNASSHLYVTDALKAVSSYQQKYGQRSIFTSDRLPSPTPSEEEDNGGDAHGEVSSSSASGKTAPTVTNQMPVLRSSSSSDILTGGPPGYAKQGEQLASGSNPALKPASKSRDPRLRFMNSDTGGALDSNRRVSFSEFGMQKDGSPGGASTNNRKNKAVDEPSVDETMSKKARNGVLNPRVVQMPPGRGGWIVDGSNVASYPGDGIQLNQNTKVEPRNTGNVDGRTDSQFNSNTNNSTSNARTVQALQSSSASAVSLPALLKDIAVNPTMLMQLLEQQKKLASESQQKAAASSANMSNTVSGNVTAVVNGPPKPTEVGQNTSRVQTPAQAAPVNSQNDAGVIRMKPRDPRRILHNSLAQKSDTVGSEPTKMNGTVLVDSQNSKDCLTAREQGEQLQTSASPPQAVASPNLARPFTKNPKNPADNLSNSQLAAATLLPPSITQQALVSVNKAAMRPPAGQNDPNTAPNSAPGGASGGLPSTDPWGDVDHLLDGYDDQQKAAIQKERSRRIMEQHKMFASRKLCLVLDLDHTLLNSAKFIEVDPIHEEILRKKEEQDRERPQRHLFRFQHMGMWTKLRPGIWNFLEKASKLYELHLYTMGNKLYATEMAKVLDPTGSLFAGRVISRGDDGDPFDGDERVPKSKDLDGVLGMESAVVIIDDSVRVWPHNKHNLIVVERYTYFPCSRRQFGLLGPSLLEIDRDERPEDGTLASSLAVIERIHQNFFVHRSLNEADVRSILAAEQRRILAGCRIVFSRIFPVGEANPHLHPLWQTAEQFGAVCSNQIDEHVTHVVANSLGTDKVNWALSTGRFVVHPGWVEASALLYRRANEQDFAVKP